MAEIDSKHKVAILRVLRDAGGTVGSVEIARALRLYGFDLSARTIRLYLSEMEEGEFVASAGRGRKGGRRITPTGLAEIDDAMVAVRVGFTAAKVDALTWQMTFNPVSAQGTVIINVTLVEEALLAGAIETMLPVYEAGLSMGDYLALARPGERLGGFQVPEGKAGIGTICSVTLNGALLSARIPMAARFGGVLEMDEKRPVRFTDVIYYDGTSLDPLQIFIKGGLTSVGEVARTGKGRIGASFREFPTAALSEVTRLLRRLKRLGLDGVVMVGPPGQPLLDFPVHEGRTGLIVAGGMNPAAALEEAGFEITTCPMSGPYDFARLIHFREALDRIRSGDLHHARMS